MCKVTATNNRLGNVEHNNVQLISNKSDDDRPHQKGFFQVLSRFFMHAPASRCENHDGSLMSQPSDNQCALASGKMDRAPGDEQPRVVDSMNFADVAKKHEAPEEVASNTGKYSVSELSLEAYWSDDEPERLEPMADHLAERQVVNNGKILSGEIEPYANPLAKGRHY